MSNEYTPTTEEVRDDYQWGVHACGCCAERKESDAEAFDRWLSAERRKWQAEALRDAAGIIPEFPEPDNPYSYDPWDDDSVDPTNLGDVTGAAVDRGWSMGAFRAREAARRTILARAAELENGEGQ